MHSLLLLLWSVDTDYVSLLLLGKFLQVDSDLVILAERSIDLVSQVFCNVLLALS